MTRAFSLMERAPWYVIYAFHVPVCLYFGARYGGLTLPTIANPGLDASGLTNESKAELFSLLGPAGLAHLPPFVPIVPGAFSPEDALVKMRDAGFSFPAVVKPDIGRRGFGVKIVHSEAQLCEHVRKFPPAIRLLLQRFAPGPYEAGIFYVRMPSEAHGRIISLTIKHFPEIVGDGTSTVRDLILRDARARVFAKLYFKRNHQHLERVLARGESYRIVSLGNHVRGSVFEDASQHITPAMEQAFDTIAKEVDGFFIGRFDVRYRSLEELKCGEAFEIVEYNGASGEPTHMWDARASIADAYSGLFAHLRYLYEIGAQTRARGAQAMPLREIVRRHFAELRLLESYPDEE